MKNPFNNNLMINHSRIIKNITRTLLVIMILLSYSFANDPLDMYKDMPPLSYDSIIGQVLMEGLAKGINTRVIWEGDMKNKTIALTFDDGPNAKYTPQVLSILNKEKVRASFFLVGKNAERYPALVKQIYQEGHSIGDHTYSHVRLNKISSWKIKKEVEQTRDIVKDITGQPTVLFRPPWGVFDGRSLAELAIRKFDVVLWSVDSRDWARPGAAAIKKNILSHVRNGSIILCHDSHDQIVTALPDIIEKLKAEGYKFVTVSEMIKLSM
jgi:polysaccharide deacetylase family sporulation protein PdaB